MIITKEMIEIVQNINNHKFCYRENNSTNFKSLLQVTYLHHLLHLSYLWGNQDWAIPNMSNLPTYWAYLL